MIDRLNHQDSEFFYDISLSAQNYRVYPGLDHCNNLKRQDTELKTHSCSIAVGLRSPSENVDTCLKCIVAKSPLEAMAHRFGDVVREFQFNLPPQINNIHDSLTCSSDFTSFPINTCKTSTSSIMHPYFTPIHKLYYLATTAATTTTNTNTTTMTSSILPESTAYNASKLPFLLSKSSLGYFHSKLCEKVAMPENLSQITSLNTSKNNCILEFPRIYNTDDVITSSSDSFISSNVHSTNSILNPLGTKPKHLNNLRENQSKKTYDYELYSFESGPINSCLDMSFQNSGITHEKKSYHGLENCHQSFTNGTNQCNIRSLNNLPLLESKHLLANNIINSNIHTSKCGLTEIHPLSMFNNSSESYDCINQSAKYPVVSTSIHLNTSLPIYCSNDCNNPNVKPPFSYITLIVSAMNSKLSKKITLNEIYAWIMQTFAYYRKNTRRWQNSIRHALSFNDCFIKVPRPSGEAGKGSYWTVHPLAIDMFDNGSSMRRNRKFIDENRYRHSHYSSTTAHMNGKIKSSTKSYENIKVNHHQQQSQVKMNLEEIDQSSLLTENKQDDFIPIYLKIHDQHCYTNEVIADIGSCVNDGTRKVKQSIVHNNFINTNSNNKHDYIKTITMLNQRKSPSSTMENSWKNLSSSSSTLSTLDDYIHNIYNSNNNTKINNENCQYLDCYQNNLNFDMNKPHSNYSDTDYKCKMILSSSSLSSPSSFTTSASYCSSSVNMSTSSPTRDSSQYHNSGSNLTLDYYHIIHPENQFNHPLFNNSNQKSLNSEQNMITPSNSSDNGNNNNNNSLSRTTFKWFEEFSLNQIP
ncbi:Hepatocyte nuclear factor 3-gamma [Schistosoma japonicum]|uniref:Hepatocyte nuclear factor 3-gamma n=1 Tax=Schistosoma japonicum TaxID=6182 RepID=A0A4Z2CSP7_SCHJA|nr:Hepatocyte nuclear factor 3-gamma [Schistosoma japonicum]